MNKALMIGLDGATFSLLKPLMDDGIMPFLKKFLSEGVHGDLMSTPNPLTPPAWISMVTGRSPNVHGVHDFLRPESSNGDVFLKINDSRDIRCETLWSMASRQGKRVTSLNFFGMSPPVPINGYLISGFMPWKHLRSATYPSTFFDNLKSLPNFNYKNLGMDISEEKKCVQGLDEGEHESWITVHSQRGKAWADVLYYLMETDPTDLSAIVFDGPDKIQHLFWRYLDPVLVETNPSPHDARIRELCLNHFRELDAIIERLVFLAGPETNVIMTSDHGFGATTEVVYLNEWLARNGYLKWAQKAEVDSRGKLTADRMKDHLMMIDWKNTHAYCPTPSSNAIFIQKDNGSGKGVKDEDYGEFCAKLKQQLLEYKNPADGEQIFVNVELNKRERSPDTDGLPDINIKLRDSGFVSILKSTEVVKPREKPEGTHRPNGIFIARGPDIEVGQQIQPLSILDITPLLLYFLGLPVPKDLEGRVPTEILRTATLMNHPAERQGVTKSLQDEADEPREDASDEEKEALMAQLKLLGYMD
ncbi:MAG TPA: alkaline phosphatase family protein [Coleofasciculaceae cyanobacterium]